MGGLFLDGIKHFYLTRLKGLDIKKICVATIVMEGSAPEVAAQQDKLNAIGLEFQGIPAGEQNGKRGYQLTFAIAYIRDIGLDYSIVAESFETSTPWDRVVDVVTNTKHRIESECIARKFSHYFVSARVTQVYDAGACIYFYFGFNYGEMDVWDAVRVYDELETIARKKWLPAVLSSSSVQVLHQIKQTIDPKNIMAS